MTSRTRAPDRGDTDARDTDAGPVLLVGGLATPVGLLRPMAHALEQRGHTVTPVAIGAGVGCAQRTVDTLVERIHAAADDAAEPVALVGHSRGGQFARVAAHAAPDRVAGLVTLGTPLGMTGVALPTYAAVAAMAAAGTVGVPGFLRLSCLLGACCRAFRADLRRDWPPDLPLTSVYSRADRVVPAAASIDSRARNVEVGGGHLGMLTDERVLDQVAVALRRDHRGDSRGPTRRRPARRRPARRDPSTADLRAAG
ncbi:alpha/beta fold hydrolase [Pseudonocardia sp. KRD291]|uniref:alpha/beta fold hydrolase n=1 Tax=Pseudonocardia sp. KRD291 TaxID=2792007 RepID=UPI001C49DE12|nr:alpha/beta fold hydrolase [Pseudonocardia sp. KRD291]MBW0101335.1 alpha/beta fold hydrolase [Pseudonocardia sp. KRD291]